MTTTRARLRRLRADRAGNALIEFALGMPLLMTMGGYGIELSNYTYTQVQISQYALALADNGSRVGVNNGQSVYQLREGDINDVLQGARLMGSRQKLTTFGRITLSSLENVPQSYSDHAADTTSVQRIHWQRCIGLRGGAADPGYDSSFGQALPLATAGTDTTYANRGTATTGMGSAPLVNAPSGTGVIFVEVNYQYQPVFGTMFMNKTVIKSVAAFVVRDRRDFSRIYNPATALGTTPRASTCNLWTA